MCIKIYRYIFKYSYTYYVGLYKIWYGLVRSYYKKLYIIIFESITSKNLNMIYNLLDPRKINNYIRNRSIETHSKSFAGCKTFSHVFLLFEPLKSFENYYTVVLLINLRTKYGNKQEKLIQK